MPPRILRLAYVSEFLLALLTILTLWSEVGGQDHLDLMPWYVKLVLSTALAFAVVMGTVSLVADDKALNRKALVWIGLIALILVAMASVTYYYHLHENDEEQEQNESPNPVALNAPTGRRRGEPSRSREALATARFAVPAATA
jgi:high-affinity Fe2+/Pb2+ permease